MSFDSNTTAFNGFVGVMNNVINKTKNLAYNSNKNITAIAGITNTEDLRILGQPVALRNHTHELDEVRMSYEEEETYEEETVNEEEEVVYETRTRTITKHKGLNELLDGYAKLDANNSFTGANTFNQINTSYLTVSSPGSGSGSSSILINGHDNYLASISYARALYNTSNEVIFPAKLTFSINSFEDKVGIIQFKKNKIQYVDNEGYNHYNQGTAQTLTLWDENGNTSFPGNVSVGGSLTVNGTNVLTALDEKSDVGHTHAISEITNLQTTLDGKSDVGHTHTISEITNLQTTLSSLDSKLTTHAYDSTNDTLNSVFTSMPNGSIKVMKEYPDNYWTTAIFKYDSGRSIALSVKKFIESDGDDIRIYWNQWTTDDETNGHVVGTQYSNPGYSNLLTSTNYNHWCAAANHNHDSSYAALTHTHTCADITDIVTTYAKLAAANTFTNTNYFNSNVYFYGGNVYHLYSGAANTYEYIGRNTSAGNSLCIRHYYNSTLANRFSTLGLSGYAAIALYYNKIHMGMILDVDGGLTVNSGTLTTPTITLNGSDLATLLDGKAPSVHTHTTADLTNWATATDNFAKLNAANTFTNTNYFDSSVYFYGSNVYHLVSNLANGSYVYEYIGKSNSSGNCGRFYYYQNAALANRYFSLGIHGYEGLRFYYNKLKAYQPLESSYNITTTQLITGSNVKSDNETRLAAVELGVNDKAPIIHTHAISDITDLQTTLDGKAASNHTHSGYASSSHNHDGTYAKLNDYNEFTEGQRIRLNYGNSGLLLENTRNEKNIGVHFNGLNSRGSSKSASIQFEPNDDALIVAHSGYTPLSVKRQEITVDGILETAQTTPADALGSNLQDMIFQVVYPVGSIYITNTVISGYTVDNNNNVKATVHGCVFQLLPSNSFIKNVNWYLHNGTEVELAEGDDYGMTGGSATHSHGLSNGYACMGVGGENVIFTRRTGSENIYMNYAWAAGNGIGGFSGYWNRYGSQLGGNSNSASSLPPYMSMWIWRRIQ